MNGTGNDDVISAETVPLAQLAKVLYRRIPKMPKAARPFAYNLIELIEGDVMSAPAWGDHKLQQPRRLIQWQLERFEQAMAGG